MRLVATASHRHAQSALDELKLGSVAKDALNAPRLDVTQGSSKLIKAYVASYLTKVGWASPVRIDPGQGLTLNAQHRSGVVFHAQTGNIARAFYDLMKLQSLHLQGRAPAAILVVPTSAAARIIGGNLASFDRVRNELKSLFFHQISVPILLAAFE